MLKIAMVYGQHGDEYTSLRIVRELKKYAPKDMFTFVGPVNSEGLSKNTREDPKTGKDFNRSHPGNVKGDFVDKKCQKIFGKCRQADLVIDLHNFVGKKTATTAYIYGASRSMIFAALLTPKMIKKISDKERGTLIRELQEIGVPGLILETSPSDFFSQKDVRELAQKIIALCKAHKKPKTAQIFTSVEKFYAEKDTEFIPNPNLEPGQQIAAGEIIGTENSKNLITTKSGILQAISPKILCTSKSEVAIVCTSTTVNL